MKQKHQQPLKSKLALSALVISLLLAAPSYAKPVESVEKSWLETIMMMLGDGTRADGGGGN